MQHALILLNVLFQIRNGPGQFHMGDRNMTHAFDGFAKLHSFHFSAGSSEVLFSAKFLQSNFYKSSVSSNTIAPYMLLDQSNPPYGGWERLMSMINGYDNANINVVQYGGKTFHCLSDFWKSYEIKVDTLETLHTVQPPISNLPFLGAFGPIPAASHPVKEPGTDNYINFYYILNVLFSEQSLNVVRIKSAGETETIATIPRDDLRYMHSLGVTEDYAVLLVHPMIVDFKLAAFRDSGLEMIKWDAEKPTDIYVVHLRNGKVTHLNGPPLFFLHNINTFQEGKDKVTIDMTTYKNLNLFHFVKMDSLRKPHPSWPDDNFSQIKRLVLHLDSSRVEVHDFEMQSSMEYMKTLEMPVINPDYAHKPYCFVYGVASAEGGMMDMRLVKKDICGGAKGDKAWYLPSHFPSEPWFEPNPKATSEDDGIVFTIVLNGQNQKSYLLFLDGQTFEPINSAELPTWIPQSLHGRFFHETIP